MGGAHSDSCHSSSSACLTSLSTQFLLIFMYVEYWIWLSVVWFCPYLKFKEDTTASRVLSSSCSCLFRTMWSNFFLQWLDVVVVVVYTAASCSLFRILLLEYASHNFASHSWSRNTYPHPTGMHDAHSSV